MHDPEPLVELPAAAPGELDCVIGLGSNLADRRAYLVGAIRGVLRLGSLIAVSPLYESPAVGPPQPDYLNAAVRVRTRLEPHALLAELLELERRAGRVRLERWGPRTLDLDILWISGRTVVGPGLTVPHPELGRRAFAVLPLLDVAPDATDPVTGLPYASIAKQLDRTDVRELPSSRAGWLESVEFAGLDMPSP
ncbi:MAG TPA: 2-amino-4-hydroxy-6-hydroxymethyldihydropteridine diphosphokinase [Polyangiaceae bacterium]|jgi:2-amino-4-hydroxy-6-hydroxymethyldihydropteridine diphosphokinase